MPSLVKEALTVSKQLQTSWDSGVRRLLQTYGVVDIGSSLHLIQKKMEDTFVCKWYADLWNDERTVGGNKLRTYRTFKSNFGWEDYLSVVTNRRHRIAMCRLRVSCHNLRIETGRYKRPQIPADQRICLYCNSGMVDDEKHFITGCRITQGYRDILYKAALKDNTAFLELSEEDKMLFIFTTTNTNIIRKPSLVYNAFRAECVLPAYKSFIFVI